MLAGSGIGYGLPRRAIDSDERLVVETSVLAIASPRPINLRYPTAFTSLFRIALEPYAWWVAAATEERAFPRLVAELAVRMNPFYAVGRSLATLTGVLTVVATAALGRSLIGGAGGLIAGAILACTPVFVEYARQAKVDVPLAMWTVFALLLALRACESGRLRTAMAAAVCVGLAAGTKWSAAPLWLTLVLVARATLTTPSLAEDADADSGAGARAAQVSQAPSWTSLVLRVALLWGAAFAALLATTPAIVTDFPVFVAAATRIAGIVEQPFGEFTRPGWRAYPEELAGGGGTASACSQRLSWD